MTQPLIVANWKMHGTVEEALKLITEIRHKLEDQADAEIVLAPPYTALYSAQIILQETAFKLAAQNMHWEMEGAYTGEVSPVFLKEIGCSYVLVGHSERRRHFGETDETVNRKIRAALACELIPIFCIGETAEQRRAGKTEEVLEEQIKKGIRELQMGDLKGMVQEMLANVEGREGPVWEWIRGRGPRGRIESSRRSPTQSPRSSAR